MALYTAHSRTQAAQILTIVKTLFNYTTHYNDARTRTARRIKCVAIGAEYIAEDYALKEEQLRAALEAEGIPFLNLFFTPSKPNATWVGVVLHLIIPNQDNA